MLFVIFFGRLCSVQCSNLTDPVVSISVYLVSFCFFKFIFRDGKIRVPKEEECQQYFLLLLHCVCLFLFLFFNSLPNGVVFRCVLELSNGDLTNKVMVGPFCLLEAADAYLEFLYYIYSPKDLSSI